ncbi:hypothetical protein ACWEVP_04660 [Amycolatopsis sp. NPDC003865]
MSESESAELDGGIERARRADERDRRADERARIADERDRRADDRDRRADRRERRADEREGMADRREAQADEREARIRHYEARFETSPGSAADFESNLTRFDHEALDRAGAEVTRARDRLAAASDRNKREQAEIDREMARSVRDREERE